MIRKIWLHNYGPFEKAELTLEPLTVIVGPNASGKSIALKALWQLAKAHRDQVDRLVLTPMRKAGSEPDTVEIGVATSDQTRHVWSMQRGGPNPGIVLPSAVLLQLRPEVLRQASYLDSPVPKLQADGYGLATVLADMKLSDSRAFESILRQTREIIPTFEDVRFKRAKVENERQSVIGNALVFDMKNAPDLRPQAVSDGTMLTLGLLTILFSSLKEDAEESRPKLFLIDELERSLHPKALGELVVQLRRLAQEFDIQILATSHSPYLVDGLRPEEVRITGLLEDGSAIIRELGDHPEFDRWKDEMTPGEFWSTVGEDWS